jgi:hypothetical protein
MLLVLYVPKKYWRKNQDYFNYQIESLGLYNDLSLYMTFASVVGLLELLRIVLFRKWNWIISHLH